MAVEFQLLGEVGARVGGRWVELGHARQRCVLAALVVEPNRQQSLDVLVERVWGDRPPNKARTTLYGYLYRLRQAFADVPDVRIDRTAAGYVLPVDEDRVDLHRFRRLAGRAHDAAAPDALALADRALGLWRGEALGGLTGEWVDALRRALEQQRWQTLLHRNDIALRLGHHDTLVPVLADLADRHPLDERLAGQLVLALYRSGRQADALRHYRLVRDRLVEELGTDPGPQLRGLHQQVLEGEPPAHPPPPVPRQLPATHRTFVGRVDQLAALDKALSPAPGEAPMLALVGSAGTGKTTLALHWAHRAADRFPDGHLYADLRGFDPTGAPVPAAAGVGRFLEALGLPAASVPPDPDGRAALYRSLVAGKRLLVVLDNARDSEHVLPLLPGGSTCTVLITSRHRLTGLAVSHAVPTLELDVFTDAEARELLARHLSDRRLRAEPDAVTDLLRWCGGLPLALGIIAARAATHPEFPLSVLVDELRDGVTALGSDGSGTNLRAVFDASVRVLPDAAATAFTGLAAAPGPDIALPAAAATLDVPPRRARELLRHLETGHLVRQHTPGRYRMHDLVRAYATERAHTDPRPTLRLIDHYARTGRAAEAVLYPHEHPAVLGGAPSTPDITDEPAALAWLTAEHANLLAAQQAARRLGSHHHVWELAWALDTFQRRQGLIADQVAVWRTADDAADDSGQPDARALTSWRLGTALARTGALDEAIVHLERSLGLCADPSGQASVHQSLAWVREQQGDDHAALHHATSALEVLRTLGVPMREAHALNQAGWYAARVDDLEPAQRFCEEALEITRRHDDRDAEARVLDSLGYIAHLAGRHDTAAGHYEQALLRFEEAGASYDYADTLARLGDTHAANGNVPRALTAWREASTMYRRQHRELDAQRLSQRIEATSR
ncbi:BTAD domain-containing putative transcriptional regulator [Saccharothrix sp. NPDC042600]|uniref:AfsR/SARP family transcriptional regulator n=1 Tax=Saccharothrix sp. NPDC042600 TaxID=3154492 RepID=UPI0034086B8F